MVREGLGTPVEAREINDDAQPHITVGHQLFGVSLSGGGIRSAALNLGILQSIDEQQLFDEVDYLSTVSGGGYTGTAISSFMRKRNKEEFETEFDLEEDQIHLPETTRVAANTRFGEILNRLKKRFGWMPKFWLFFFEMFSWVNHRLRWVNVSDGGHIENLGVYELLKRRCQLIFIGDGEADPNGVFDGLSTLVRLAKIDLGIDIEFEDDLALLASSETDPRHFSIGKVKYPQTETNSQLETGYVIYLKSGMPKTKDLVLENYLRVSPSFPHESTLDQNFDESQFEAYRRIGYLNTVELLRWLADANEIPAHYAGLLAAVEQKSSGKKTKRKKKV